MASASERQYEEGRRAGLLEAASSLEDRSEQAERDGYLGAAALLDEEARRLRALAGPAQARLDGGEEFAGPPAGLPTELTARALVVLRAHLEAREKFFREERGVYQPPTKAAQDEALAAIRDALKRHHETNGDREKWRRESAVLAAGVGIFYSEPHNGEMERKRTAESRLRLGRPKEQALPRLYLELWRPWKLQKGKPDPVPGFAELCFDRRREVAGGR